MDQKITLKTARFLVLRESLAPALTLEMGYLSNEKERELLNSSKSQQEMATYLYQSLLELKKMNKI